MLGELSYEVLHCAVSSSVSLQKFYKGWRRAARPASPRSGDREREKKKKGHRSPCEKNNRLSAGDATFQWIVQLQVSAKSGWIPDFLRDDTHRSVPLSRRGLSLSSLCICYVLMCVSHIYGLRLIVIIVLSSGLRTLSRREERPPPPPSSRLVEVFVTFKGSQCAAATRKDRT